MSGAGRLSARFSQRHCRGPPIRRPAAHATECFVGWYYLTVSGFLASPGGKLPALTALRNRQGWLMRGGDRLVSECSWMNGICSNFLHSTGESKTFKLSPPLISLFCQSVPKCRLSKKPATPRGKPRRLCRPGRQIGDPYNGGAKSELHTPINKRPAGQATEIQKENIWAENMN